MYLKRLEMYGFKSFADKTVLELLPGLTTVIGPNGSGKSNISDCIRWVLGEQSLKSLRGAKSEDIIFAGTQNRKPLGYAEASLVLDNSDSKLPIEYNEVIVTRRIYRTGESGYFINKTPCRLKDVLELFMDTNARADMAAPVARLEAFLNSKNIKFQSKEINENRSVTKNIDEMVENLAWHLEISGQNYNKHEIKDKIKNLANGDKISENITTCVKVMIF